ncbi:hypothetical protein H0H87_011902, partial [Tephrocybe sp. NHM501043]
MISGKRIRNASSRITDTNNVGKIILSSHRDAQKADIDARNRSEAATEEQAPAVPMSTPIVPLQAPPELAP